MSKRDKEPQTGREIFEGSDSGAENRPFIPKLRSDPIPQRLPRTLEEFRQDEGRDNRKRRLKELWRQLHDSTKRAIPALDNAGPNAGLTPEVAQRLINMYEKELLRKCGGHNSSTSPMAGIEWKDFKEYATAKEEELWNIFHRELDLDGNGHLDANFMTTLTASEHSHSISFAEFRDFLLLLPMRASPAEIYRYYEMRRYLGDDARGAARVTMEGDVSLSAEDRPTIYLSPEQGSHLSQRFNTATGQELSDHEEEDEENDPHAHDWLEGHDAFKFLLAGGMAGADLGGTPITSAHGLGGGARVIGSAIARIYAEGGVLAFWTGNGLSVAKIMPESAIKFFSYESSKRAFAKYWDKVDDTRDISGVSRFLSGGIGGITSQLSIYPIETLKTQMMSNTGELKAEGAQALKRDGQAKLVAAARHLWSLGGFRAYYRGLTIGLVGVFPYSAIDMSTFEALKLAYSRSTGTDEPGVLATLAFGSISGSIGATTVYPLNLVRTRLQASGSSGHPQKYTGVWDVTTKTWERDGWRGFYRGLFPTLAKVVPAVSISYVVYEQSKRKLGV
ncbi:mitochondrial carrier protein [Favolaschia claudopus]|uniref:Mitochondrial carrier protein n=1 Tax=Favolaschia claudopus TaxID=2862362 RepID=A0AAW0EDP0_9AGAR